MDIITRFGCLLLVCLLPGVVASSCDDDFSFCPNGCCYVWNYHLVRTTAVCCSSTTTTAIPSSIFDGTVNLAVIIGASVGGFLLLVVIVSVIACIICCTNTSRGQVGQVVQGQTTVVAGSYPMQTTNMQPGINQWQQQQPNHSNQTPNLQPGANQWQHPPPYRPTGEGPDNYKRQQQPPVNYP